MGWRGEGGGEGVTTVRMVGLSFCVRVSGESEFFCVCEW